MIVIASGTLIPNQSTPEYELAGSARSMNDWTNAQVRTSAPRTGRTPIEHEVLGAVQKLVAVVERAGVAGQAVVERDHQAERGERVVVDVLGHDLEADVERDRQDAHPDRRVGRRLEAWVDLRPHLRDRALGAHRQGRSGGRQDRRLGRRRSGREDRQDEDLVERRAEDLVGHDREDVALTGLAERGDARPRLGRDCHDDVGRNEDQRRHDRGPARLLGRVGALLVRRGRRVPAPVDEQRDDEAGRERARAERAVLADDRERVEPFERRQHRPGGRIGVDAEQGDGGEDRQGDQLDREEDDLGPGRQLDAAIADPGQRRRRTGRPGP